MKRIIISTLHDPKGVFEPLIHDTKELLLKHCENKIIVSLSSVSSPETRKLLESMKMGICPGDSWGRGRLNALRTAIDLKAEYFMAIDFDKLIHWLKDKPDEFEEYLEKDITRQNILGGRSNKAWATYPESWRNTEAPANEMFYKATGIQADILTAQMYFNKNAAIIINKYATEEEWGSCAEWPMLLWKNQAGLRAEYFDGLSFEDPDRIKMTDSELYKLYDSKEEWDKRLRNQSSMETVIRRLGPS